MTVPPTPPGTPTHPTPAQTRYDRALLAQLTSVVKDPKFRPFFSIEQLIFRLGERGVREAEPLIVQLTNLDPRRNYCVCRALGQIGSLASVAIPGGFFGDPGSSPMVRRMAGEALRRLLHPTSLQAFRAHLLSQLPDPLRAAVEGGDPEAFAAALRAHLAPMMSEDLAVLDTLYLLDGPVIRPAILAFARTAPLKPPQFRCLRSLFKAAEYRRDGELFGLLVHRFETGQPGARLSHHSQASLASKGQVAFGPRTRDYLRRRAWRTLRHLGQRGDPAFVPMAVGALLPFTDSDAAPVRPYGWGRWGASRGQGYYPPFAPYFTLSKLLSRNDHRLRWNARLFVHVTFHQPDPLPRRPGDEAFPDLWRARPEGLLHLLDESRCAAVHDFAAPALAACEDFCASLDRDAVLMLISRPYAATAALGFSLLLRHYDPAAPDLDLLALVVSCAHAPARQVALGWVDQLGPRLLSETGLVVALVTSPHGDVRDHIRSLLGSRAPTTAQAEAIVTGSLAALLALGPEGNEAARGAARTLLQRFSPQLAAIGGPLLMDLLQHPLTALQALGGEILVFGRVTVSDEILLILLRSPAEDVRAAGLLLLDQLLDVALPTRTELISRLLVQPDPALRTAARRLARRLAGLGADLEQALGGQVVEAILRRKLPEGVAEELARVLREDLPGALGGLDAATVWRLLSSASPEAQGLGDVLLRRHDLGGVLTVDQIGKLADQETLALREAAWAMFERHPAKMKTDLAGAVRVLDARWGDTRAFGFRFFREHFAPGELPPETLVAICDSIRPEVEAFGREMLARHARDEDGLELLWRLSEHPAIGVQLHVTEFLDRHAAGDAAKIAALEPYFQAVLGRVNRGRTAKKRVLAFLRREGEASPKAAQIIVPILHRLSATSSIEYRAAALAALVALGRAHPGVEIPVRAIPREARGHAAPATQEDARGVQLYVPG
jgi:hypothetical protein